VISERQIKMACSALVAGLALAGSAQGQSDVEFKPGAPAAVLKVSSLAFAEGQRIPPVHTGDGKNVSPPLQWSGSPAGAKSFALIADDPDAPVGTWVHWVIYNLPATDNQLPEAVPSQEHLANGARQGKTSFHKNEYGGPAPPPGKVHRYYFKLYALDTKLNLPPDADKEQLLKAMTHHVIATGQTMGTYSR